ncbi:MAG: nickel-type superoxide dismutase maturation protease [Myxococcota bacterium]
MKDEQATDQNRSPVSFVHWKDVLLWLLGSRLRKGVTGHSMEPTLNHGDQIFVRPSKVAAVGDVVLCRHPYKTETHIVKRVQSIDKTGLMLTGDNPSDSTDSSSFGRVPWVHLIGVVTSRARQA